MASPNDPRIMLMGEPAFAAAARLMASSHKCTVDTNLGPVTLVPGTVWERERVLLDCSPMTVHYMVGTKLYEWGTQAFIRDQYLNGLSRGATQARWLVNVAKAEMEFLMGLLVPIWGVAGITAAKLITIYGANQKEFVELQKYLPLIKDDLDILKREVPTLYNAVMNKAQHDFLVHLPEGITATEIAFWLGRMIRGAAAALPNLTVAAFTKILASVTALVALGKSIPIAAHAADATIKAVDIVEEFKKAQTAVTREEAEAIAKEMMKSKQSKEALKRLEINIKAVLPSIQAILKAFGKVF